MRIINVHSVPWMPTVRSYYQDTVLAPGNGGAGIWIGDGADVGGGERFFLFLVLLALVPGMLHLDTPSSLVWQALG